MWCRGRGRARRPPPRPRALIGACLGQGGEPRDTHERSATRASGPSGQMSDTVRRMMVGVDAGKESHLAAVDDPAGDRVLGHLRFPVDRPGFEQFCAFVRRAAGEAGAVVVGMEASGHYHLTLAEFLADRGYPGPRARPGAERGRGQLERPHYARTVPVSAA